MSIDFDLIDYYDKVVASGLVWFDLAAGARTTSSRVELNRPLTMPIVVKEAILHLRPLDMGNGVTVGEDLHIPVSKLIQPCDSLQFAAFYDAEEVLNGLVTISHD